MSLDSSGAENSHETERPGDDCPEDPASTLDQCEKAGGVEAGDAYPDPDPDLHNRLWLKAVAPLLQLRSHEGDPNGRVQFALDQMYIAACERLARILGSDLGRRDR